MRQPSNHRLFEGRVPRARARNAADPTSMQSLEPISTIGSPLLRGEVLKGSCFAQWARHRRIGLSYNMFIVLEDDCWDVWRASQVTKGVNGARRSLVRLCEGAYQIPSTINCDRAFTPNSMEAGFVAAVDGYLRLPDVTRHQNPIRLWIAEWGGRLPDYSEGGNAAFTRCRQWHSFEWAMLIDEGYVVTKQDWEVTKGISSVSAFEGKSVQGLISDGFHLSASNSFPATPASLRGPASVPAGLVIPPLWSLRYFAAFVFGNGSPTGTYTTSASTRQRLTEIMEDEVVLCLALGVTAERAAFRRTPILPAELIKRIQDYDGPDTVPTSGGSVSIREVAARLMKARTIPTDLLVQERPLHVTTALYYAPDEVVDETPVVTASMEPQGQEPVQVHSTPLSAPAGKLVQVQNGTGVVPTPVVELSSHRLSVAEFEDAYPFLRCAVLPLHGKPKASLREVLECLSGWVRNVDPDARRAGERGSRGGTAGQLRRIKSDLAASLEEREQISRRLREMTERVERLSGPNNQEVGATTGKRRREDYEETGVDGPPPFELDTRARRFRREKGPEEDDDSWYRRHEESWYRTQ